MAQVRPIDAWFPDDLYEGGRVDLPSCIFYLPGIAGIPPRLAWLFVTLVACRRSQGIFPSISTLSRMTGLSPRWVKESLKKLEQLGLIRIHRQSGKLNRYDLTPSYDLLRRVRDAVLSGEVEFTGEVESTSEENFTPPVKNSSPTGEVEFTPPVKQSSPEQLNSNSNISNSEATQNQATHSNSVSMRNIDSDRLHFATGRKMRPVEAERNIDWRNLDVFLREMRKGGLTLSEIWGKEVSDDESE